MLRGRTISPLTAELATYGVNNLQEPVPSCGHTTCRAPVHNSWQKQRLPSPWGAGAQVAEPHQELRQKVAMQMLRLTAESTEATAVRLGQRLQQVGAGEQASVAAGGLQEGRPSWEICYVFKSGFGHGPGCRYA